MTNDMTVAAPTAPANYPADLNQSIYRPEYDEKRVGKYIDEVIAAAKDDRANTKRAISADIASTARVQNQNDRFMDACERELRRKDLPESRREELLADMKEAALRLPMPIRPAENFSVNSLTIRIKSRGS